MTDSGLIIPEKKTKLTKTIADFDMVSPMELKNSMIDPINNALAQGVPPETPSAVSLDAMARMCKTIIHMAEILNVSEQTLKTILDDETVPNNVKTMLRTLPILPQIDIDDLFNKNK